MTDKLEDTSSILGILKNEDESERVRTAETDADTLSLSDVEKKAKDKYNVLEVPTERKVKEDLAKLGGQIQTADTHRVIEIQQGETHPLHRTYGDLGMPLSGAKHDYDKDRNITAATTVTGKDDPEVKKHNADLKKVRDAINKKNDEK